MRRIVFLALIISVTAGLGTIWYLAGSFDFAPSTKDNPYGVQAKVIISPTTFSPPIEPKIPIEPIPVLWFRYNSEKPVQLIGYNVCNGLFCIKREVGGSYGPAAPELMDQPDKWAGGTMGDLHWKVGDTVHIRIKIKTVTISDDGQVILDSDKMMFIDLGESKIIQGDIVRG